MNLFAFLRNALAFTAVAVLVTPWLERASKTEAAPSIPKADNYLSKTGLSATEVHPLLENSAE